MCLPSGDEDLLIAIIEDAGQLAFVAAIARLRAAAFDLLSATSSAPAPEALVPLNAIQDMRPYAFSDLFATREPFPAMKMIDREYRM